MIVRTISQLPEADESEIKNLNYYEMSKRLPTGDYVSKKMAQYTLDNHYRDISDTHMANKYALYDENGDPIQVSSIMTTIDVVKNNNIEFNGTKTFTQVPKYNNENIITESSLSVALDEQPIFIRKDNQTITTNPGVTTDKDNNKIINIQSFGMTNGMLRFLMHNEGGGSRSHDADNSNKNPKCNKTGNLVMYGWLCDNGQLMNTQCWVAIEGYLQNKDGTAGRWQILQVQPWIQGTNSSNIQYIGFNVPVKKDLELRITTGFQVGSQTNLNTQNSLALPIDSNGSVPSNCFIGYII